MTRFMKSLGAAVGAALLAVAATSAQAQTVRVDFSLPQASDTFEMTPSAQDTTVTFDPNPGDFVDLTPGVLESNVFLSGGDVDLFQGANASGSGTLTRPLTAWIGSGTPDVGQLSQAVDVFTYQDVFGSEADVFIRAGSPVVFDLGSYELTVTPRAFSRTGQTSNNIPINNSADFLLEIIPEPASGLLVIAGIGLLATRRQRRGA